MGIFKHLQDEIEERDKREGITLAELLELSKPLRQIMKQITRQGQMSVEEAADFMGESPAEVEEMLNSLVEKGYLERENRDEVWIYRVRFARKRARSLPPGIWSALGERTQEE